MINNDWNDYRCKGCKGATLGVEDRPMTKGERIFDMLVASPIDWFFLNWEKAVVGAFVAYLIYAFHLWAATGFSLEWLGYAP